MDFENHHHDQLHQVTAERNTCRRRLTGVQTFTDGRLRRGQVCIQLFMPSR